MIIYSCPIDKCLGVLVIAESVSFPDASPDLMVEKVSQFLCLVVLFSFCLTATMTSAYVCMFSCSVCVMFLVLFSFMLSLSSAVLIAFMDLHEMVDKFIYFV